MKKYKYILGVSMLGLLSEVSVTATVLNTPSVAATVLNTPADQEHYSQAGYHGTRHGRPSSYSAENLSRTITLPSALGFLIPGDNGGYFLRAIFPFPTTESVADLKAWIIDGYRLSAGIRFMVGSEEVMRDVVRRDGTLVTLAEAFEGKGGIVQIKVVLDNSRSPMHSAMPTQPDSPSAATPRPDSPSAATPLELPSVSE